MTAIYVDADACPVKDEVVRVADRHGVAVHMVSNAWMRLSESPLVERVVVPEGPDVADDWIAERIGDTDIAITTDIPLAARCLAAGAQVLTPAGKAFSEDGIGNALAMRDLMGQLRDAGEIRGGAAAFSKRDRTRFLDAMEATVRAALKG